MIVREQLERAAHVPLGFRALAAREIGVGERVLHAGVLRVELLGREELAQRERAAAVREMVAADLEARGRLARVLLGCAPSVAQPSARAASRPAASHTIPSAVNRRICPSSAALGVAVLAAAAPSGTC